MGAGHFEKVEGKSRSTSRSSAPLRHAASTVYIPPLRSLSSSNNNGDRLIPNRSAMDFDFAHCMLTEPRTETSAAPASTSVYRKLLSEVLFNKRTRLHTYQNKPPAPTNRFSSPFDEAPSLPSRLKKQRFIPVNPQSAERTLYVPDIIDDFNLNLLDWGSRNILSIAHEHSVYLLDYSAGCYDELLSVGEANGPVTSISWAPDGEHFALGLQNSYVLVCDSTNHCLVRILSGVHQSRVGSLAWNNNILTTGGMDGKVVNNDVRIRSHALQTYRGHTGGLRAQVVWIRPTSCQWRQ